MKIIAYSGSLRKKSFNSGLLRAALELVPEGLEIMSWDISQIPLYNADLDEEGVRPETVEKMKQAIKETDGLLIVTPEYHYSIPGVTKNVIDWVGSNPNNVLEGKRVALMGASTSGFGTVRGQLQLRQALFGASAVTFDEELMVSFARKKFDQDGNLTDKDTKLRLKNFLESFLTWLKSAYSQTA